VNAIIRDLINTRDGATYIAARVWGIHTHYNPGGGHTLVGHSVPNFELEDGTRIGELMHDARGSCLILMGTFNLKPWRVNMATGMKYIADGAKETIS